MVEEVHGLEVDHVSYHVVVHAFHDEAVGGCKLEVGVMKVNVGLLFAYDVLDDLYALTAPLGLDAVEDDWALLLAI